MSALLWVIAAIVGITALLLPELAMLLFMIAPLVKLFLKIVAPITRVYDLTAVIMVLLALSLGIHLVRHGGVGAIRWHGKILFLLCFLLVLVSFSYTYTDAPNYGWDKLIRALIALPVGLMAPIAYLRNDKQAKRLLLYILFSSVFVAFGTVISPDPEYTSAYARGTFLESNPITTGSSIAYGIAICMAWIFDKYLKIPWRIMFFAFIPIMVLGIFFTGSRGPLVGVAIVGLAFFLLQVRSLQFRHYLIIGVLFLAGVVAIIYYLPESYWYRFGFLRGEETKATFTSGRLPLWSSALEGAMSSPILGHGIGGFGPVTQQGDVRTYPHNMFLELLVEQGIFAMILGMILMGIPFIKGYRNVRMLRGHRLQSTAMAFFFLFLVSFIDAMKSGDLSDNRRLWFFIGCLLGFDNILQHYIRNKTDGPSLSELQLADGDNSLGWQWEDPSSVS